MAEKKSARESTTRSSVVERAVRSDQDRETDPLFVPHLDALRTRAVAEATDRDEYAAILESICGATDDSQPVEQYDGSLGVTVAFVAAHQSAACQVQWNSNLAAIYTNPGNVSGVRWGSGTMISDDLFLTCGHLFDQTGGGWERPRQNGTTNIISPPEIARNMRLNFNFQVDPAGNLRPEQSFPILELIEYRLGGLDMAVCRIGGNPGAMFGREQVSTTDAAVPDMICIIGHPAGQPKRIEAGPTTAIDGNLIRYNDIDTLGGNSGSGVLRASDGRLVGIHTNGGCGPTSPGTGGSNFGQRIAAVIGVSPTLQAVVAPKRKILDDPIPKLKSVDDFPKRKVVDDPIPKSKFLDDAPKRKLLDDPIPKLKVVDDGLKRKNIDDVKSPAFDKSPGLEGKFPSFDNKAALDRPGLPGSGGFGRGAGPQTPPARPFVLSTPHHAPYWQGEAQQADAQRAGMEAMLAQLEQAIDATAAHLSQLDADYRQLLAEYQALGGGS